MKLAIQKQENQFRTLMSRLKGQPYAISGFVEELIAAQV